MPVDEIDEEMHYGEDEVDSDDDQESFDESEEEGAAETEEEVAARAEEALARLTSLRGSLEDCERETSE